MKIYMQEAQSTSELSFNTWYLGLVGQSLDERGNAAIDFLVRNTSQIVFIQYDPNEFTIKIDGDTLNAENLEDYLRRFHGHSIILETTTLGFVEIFLCCRAFQQLGFQQFSFLYVEPLQYALHITNLRRSQLLHKRDFDLSYEVAGYKPIPGATLILSDETPQRTVFFVGYEERRLDRALEDYQMIQPTSCSLVFGVPAFRPGWEMDAFANNIRVIRERNIRGGVYFCGAESPLAAVEVLRRIKRELKNGERLFIGPIGTKPHGLGVALFASCQAHIGILYDHPTRRQGRTSKISRWHLYNVELTRNP